MIRYHKTSWQTVRAKRAKHTHTQPRATHILISISILLFVYYVYIKAKTYCCSNEKRPFTYASMEAKSWLHNYADNEMYLNCGLRWLFFFPSSSSSSVLGFEWWPNRTRLHIYKLLGNTVVLEVGFWKQRYDQSTIDSSKQFQFIVFNQPERSYSIVLPPPHRPEWNPFAQVSTSPQGLSNIQKSRVSL